MWRRHGIALMLVRRLFKGDSIAHSCHLSSRRSAGVWCIASFVVVHALAASLERIEFEGASQPLMPGDRIQGLLARPDGAGPFPAVIGLHCCAGMHETTKQKLADDLVAWGYVTLLVDSFGTREIDHCLRI